MSSSKPKKNEENFKVCDRLLLRHARRPVLAADWRNVTPVLGILSQIADTEFVASCLALLDDWNTILEIRGHGLIGLAELALVERKNSSSISLPTPKCSLEEYFLIEALDTRLLDDQVPPFNPKEELENTKCPKQKKFDAVILHTDNSIEFPQLLLDAEHSLEIANKGILMINIVSKPAQMVLILLRARYDIDVASCALYDGGFAIILKRSNNNPLNIEAMPPNVVNSLEWPRSEAGGARNPLVAQSKAQALQYLDLSQSHFLHLIDLASLLAWFISGQAGKSFQYRPHDDYHNHKEAMRIVGGYDFVLLATDATKWREACFKQLYPTIRNQSKRQHAAECFRALADTQQFSRLANPGGNLRGIQTKRAADLLPYAFLLASQGNAIQALDALSTAYKVDPSWTRLALLRAAHFFADL
eukprot:CAMPEP_0197313888 /NCGR_PEP_ID=MMETSP0891-20130614/31007_1 /TAXON_ID=44058 ORGANISM="Aureoumbra lagunensis, Strain CCMP1510" /NCGR_SAMPLE_ID=MMETSP0891 /ASSEMBLY_ACC=CAM_ASM_000534 /LENGTH=416 /DNA_ID=CAMNT_0042802037 /DNA_START=190 /DNA_END=1437 /DNA_ORIENTATION=+